MANGNNPNLLSDAEKEIKKEAEIEKQIEQSLPGLNKNIQALNTAAARHSGSDQEGYLAHSKLGYWDSALSKNLEAMQARLEEAKPNDRSISAAFTKLHTELQLQNATMIATGKLDFKETSKHFEEAKNAITTIAKSIDPEIAKNKGTEPDGLKKELDTLKESGIKKHIEEQTNSAKRAHDLAFSHAYNRAINAHYKGWTHASEKAIDPNNKAAVAAAQSAYKEMKSGTYGSVAERNYNLFAAEEKDGKFRIKADASVADIGAAIGQAVDLMISKNKTPIEIFFENPKYASLEILKKIVTEITDPNKPLRESIITLDPQMQQQLFLANPKEREDFKRLSELINNHNVQFKKNLSDLQEKGQTLGANAPTATIIVDNENANRLKKQTADLTVVNDAEPSRNPKIQVKKDSSTVVSIEKALQEVTRQQALLEQKYAKATDAEKPAIMQAAKKITGLNDQLQKALVRVTARLEEIKELGATPEIRAAAEKPLEKAEALQRKVEDMRTRAAAAPPGSLAKDMEHMKEPSDIMAVKLASQKYIQPSAPDAPKPGGPKQKT